MPLLATTARTFPPSTASRVTSSGAPFTTLRVKTAAAAQPRSEKRRPRSRLPDPLTPHSTPPATNPEAAVAPPVAMFIRIVEFLFTTGIIVASTRGSVNKFIQILEYLSESPTMCGVGKKVGIYGGSGYAGAELVRLLAGHPEVGAMGVSSRGHAGRKIGEVYPQLAVEGEYVEPEELNPSTLDAAFVAYGHGESAGAVKELLDGGARMVLDLSADFRLPELEVYEEWYGDHPAPELLGEAHYGLPEVFGAPKGRLVANPGCYPTAAILALAPVVRRIGGTVRSVTINALSGVSGAGARPSVKTHFVTVNESVSPYGIVGGSPRHRHTPEIEIMLRRVGQAPEVTFVPHLLPISRGELETIVVVFGEAGVLPGAR